MPILSSKTPIFPFPSNFIHVSLLRNQGISVDVLCQGAVTGSHIYPDMLYHQQSLYYMRWILFCLHHFDVFCPALQFEDLQSCHDPVAPCFASSYTCSPATPRLFIAWWMNKQLLSYEEAQASRFAISCRKLQLTVWTVLIKHVPCSTRSSALLVIVECTRHSWLDGSIERLTYE